MTQGLALRLHLLGLLLLGALVPVLLGLGLLAAGLGGMAYGIHRFYHFPEAPGLLALWLPALGLLVTAFLALPWLVRLFRSFSLRPGAQQLSDQAPGLQEALEGLRRGWHGPKADRLLLYRGWGVELEGRPALGVLGWMRYQWSLGIFPMMALSSREFDCLASWDLVYTSEQQGWFNLQAKRLAQYWHNLAQALDAKREGRGWLRRLDARWARGYARWTRDRFRPFVGAEVFRTDAIVAREYGAPTLCRALLRQALVKPFLERHCFAEWDRRLAAGESLAPDLLAEVAEALRHFYDEAPRYLERVLEGLVPEAPGMLSARLQALEQEPVAPLPVQHSALEQLLGDSLPAVMKETEGSWRRDLAPMEAKIRITEARGLAGATGPQQIIESLQLAVERELEPEVEERLDEFIDGHPRHADGLLLRARLRFRLGRREEALEDLARARKLHPYNGPAAHRVLAEALDAEGDPEAAEGERREALRLDQTVAAARKERAGFGLNDPMLPHGLTEAQLEPMVACLQKHPQIRRAFLVRKDTRIYPEHPALLLVVIQRPRFLALRSSTAGKELLKTLVGSCPFPLGSKGFVLVVSSGLPRQLRARQDSEIYRRGRNR